MMKVCHFTSVHKDHDVRILLKECRSLAAAGYDVSLVTVNGNDRVQDGVKILSVPIESKSRIYRATAASYKVYKKVLSVNADIYHFHDPELLWVGWLLRMKNKKVIYDAHEDLPRQMLDKPWIRNGLRKIFAGITEAAENFFSARMSGVVAATPFIEERFKKINSNTVGVCNYPMLSEFDTISVSHRTGNEICYVGGVTRIRGPLELFDAIATLDIRLNLAGLFEDKELENQLRSHPGWSKVNYFGFVNRAQVKEILERSSVGVVTFHPLRNHTDARPNKMFEYMAAGLTVVASDFPLWRSILEENKCGLPANPLNATEIANAINTLVNDKEKATAMGASGRKGVLEKYNWEAEAVKLVNFYRTLK